MPFITIRIPGINLQIPVEITEMEGLMAKIDDVAAQVQNLTEAVRGFVGRQADTINQLNQELETLRADDAIENSKLEGISDAVQSLTDEVNDFGSTEVPVDPAEPEGETEPIAEQPVEEAPPEQLPEDVEAEAPPQEESQA
jgi:hypothetical protein